MYFDRERPAQIHIGTRTEALHNLFVREHGIRQCGERGGGDSNRRREGRGVMIRRGPVNATMSESSKRLTLEEEEDWIG